MHIKNLTHESNETPFGTTRGVLQINPAASAHVISEEICAKISMLEAMLCMTCGGGAESFNEYNDSIRDNYLWSCATMAREIAALSERMSALVHHQNTSTA